MDRRSSSRRRWALAVEVLESRLALSSMTVALDPFNDQFGAQIQTIQGYGMNSRASFSILDTGAAPITFSALEQTLFTTNGIPLPVKVPGGAQSSGIGGEVSGDVSQPGTIIADGIHAAQLAFDPLGFPTWDMHFTNQSASVPGVQVFIGTNADSPHLPTATGTPIFNPSPLNPKGSAALINLQGSTQDLSELAPGLMISEPDVQFVAPDTALPAPQGTTNPVRIPLAFYGADNHDDPGQEVTTSSNPVQKNVRLVQKGASLAGQQFLLDTGSQISVISTKEARALNLDLNHPDMVMTVQGAGGVETVSGFTLDALTVPLLGGDTLTFTRVPVYVTDVASDLDGVLGMNLFNHSVSLLYNPFGKEGASLSVTFRTDSVKDASNGVAGGAGVASLSGLNNLSGFTSLTSLSNLADGYAANFPAIRTILVGNLPAPDLGSSQFLSPLFRQINSQLHASTSLPALVDRLVALKMSRLAQDAPSSAAPAAGGQPGVLSPVAAAQPAPSLSVSPGVPFTPANARADLSLLVQPNQAGATSFPTVVLTPVLAAAPTTKITVALISSSAAQPGAAGSPVVGEVDASSAEPGPEGEEGIEAVLDGDDGLGDVPE